MKCIQKLAYVIGMLFIGLGVGLGSSHLKRHMCHHENCKDCECGKE